MNNQLLKEIQDRAELLNYISETDAHVDVFVIGRGVFTLSINAFRVANPFITEQPIEVFNFEMFFTRLEDDDKNWAAMHSFLKLNLTQTKVFKVGDINKDIYAVGLSDSRIVGIRTFAAET